MELRHQHKQDRDLDPDLDRVRDRERDDDVEPLRWPGKVSRTEKLAVDPRVPELRRIRGALASLRAGGKPLPGALTAQFGTLLGLDLSDVRVHQGGAAGRAARALNARAFTHGTDIAVTDQLDLDSAFGNHVLAHELVHVAQHKRASAPAARGVGANHSAIEAEAERGARALTGGRAFAVQAHAQLPAISRYGDDEEPDACTPPVDVPGANPPNQSTPPANQSTPPTNQSTPAGGDEPSYTPSAPPASTTPATPGPNGGTAPQGGGAPQPGGSPAPGQPGYTPPGGTSPAPNPTAPPGGGPRPAPAPAPAAPRGDLDARVQEELEKRADPTAKAQYSKAVGGVDALRIQALQFSFQPNGIWNTLVETFTAKNAFQDHASQIYSGNAYRGGRSWADTAQAWIEGLRGVIHIIGDIASVVAAWAGLAALVTGALALVFSETVIGGIALGAIAAIAAEVAMVAGAIKLLTDIIDFILGIIQMIILIVRARSSKDPGERARFAQLLHKEANDFGANVVSIGMQVAVMAISAGVASGMSKGTSSFMQEFTKVLKPVVMPRAAIKNIVALTRTVAPGAGVAARGKDIFGNSVPRQVLAIEVRDNLVNISRLQRNALGRVTKNRELIPFTTANQMRGARLVAARTAIRTGLVVNTGGFAIGVGGAQIQSQVKQPSGGSAPSARSGGNFGGGARAASDLSTLQMWPSQIEMFETAKAPLQGAIDRTQRQYDMAESQAGPELAAQVRAAFGSAKNAAGQARFGAMAVKADAAEGQANTQRGLQQTAQARDGQNRMGQQQDAAGRSVDKIKNEGTKLKSPPPKEGVLGKLYNATIGRIGAWIGDAQKWVTNLVGKWAMSLAGFSKEEMDIAGIENDMREDDKKDQTSTQEAQDAALRADEVQQTVFRLQADKTRDEQAAIQGMADAQRFIMALEDADRRLAETIASGKTYVQQVTPIIAHELQTEEAGAAIDAQYVAPVAAYAGAFTGSIDSANLSGKARTDITTELGQMKASFPDLDIGPGQQAAATAIGSYETAFGQLAGSARTQAEQFQTTIQAFIGTTDYDGVNANARALDKLAADFDRVAQQLVDQLYAALNGIITQYNAHIQRAIDAANQVPDDPNASDAPPADAPTDAPASTPTSTTPAAPVTTPATPVAAPPGSAAPVQRKVDPAVQRAPDPSASPNAGTNAAAPAATASNAAPATAGSNTAESTAASAEATPPGAESTPAAAPTAANGATAPAGAPNAAAPASGSTNVDTPAEAGTSPASQESPETIAADTGSAEPSGPESTAAALSGPSSAEAAPSSDSGSSPQNATPPGASTRNTPDAPANASPNAAPTASTPAASPAPPAKPKVKTDDPKAPGAPSTGGPTMSDPGPTPPTGAEPTDEERQAEAQSEDGSSREQCPDDDTEEEVGAPAEAAPASASAESSSPIVLDEVVIDASEDDDRGPVVLDELEVDASTPPPAEHPVVLDEVTVGAEPPTTESSTEEVPQGQHPVVLDEVTVSASGAAVQRRAVATAATPDPVGVATRATEGSGGALPYLGQIQASFGHHDVGGIRYHDGSAAQEGAAALGAKAFAVGDAVAFKATPDLHTAAHEAAHVVQQRAGLRPSGGIDGGPADALEQHADAVADAVVAGRSAAPLLDAMTGGTVAPASRTGGVQRAGDVPTIKSTAAFEASGQSSERFIVGVGEELSFSSDQEGDWSATGGKPATASATGGFAWTAPGSAGQFTIKIKVKDKEASKDIAVVEPSKVVFKNAGSTISDSGGIGFTMGVGMTVLPTHVSFEGITIRELPGEATGVTGYFKFAQKKGLSLHHDPKPTPTRIDPGNDGGVDDATMQDSASAGNLPRPISVGSMTWHIPYAYSCGDVKDKVFTIVAQTMSIVDSKGTITITKGAAADSRGPTAPKTKFTEQEEKKEAAAKAKAAKGSSGAGARGSSGRGAAGYGVGAASEDDGTGYAVGGGAAGEGAAPQGDAKPDAKATPLKLKNTALAVAPGGDDSRTTVGVGEKIKFTSDEAGKWQASAVGPKGVKEPAKDAKSYRWVAPATAGSVTITFTTKDGRSANTTMTVIAPTVDYKFPSALEYKAGKQGAGMVTQVRFEPYEVSFANTQWLEIGGGASNVQGYFSTHAPPYHHPNKNWLSMSGGMNDGPTDTAAFWGFPAPWSAGSFEWKIPTMYRVIGEGGSGHKIDDIIQKCVMLGGADAGTTTVSKGSSSVTRAPSEAPKPKKKKGKAKGQGAGEGDRSGFGRGDGNNSTTPAATFSPDMIETATGKVVKAGAVDKVESVVSGDQVLAQAPGVSMTATVTLKPGVDPGPTPVMAGWVQTVISGRRAAVYSKNGKVVRKDVIAFSSTRDAKRGVTPPWYETPETLSKSKPSAFPIVEDQPKIQFPKQMGDATATALEGADSFNVALKTGTDPANLTTHQAFTWSVPWNVAVDTNGGISKGGDLGTPTAASGSVDPANTTPANERGNDPKNRIKTYETEDAALEALNSDYQAFLRDMARHKQMAPDSYWKMVGALWKSGKKAYAKLYKISDSGTFSAELKCDKTQSIGTIKTDGAKHEVLAHMLYDPAALGPSSTITLQINGATVAHLPWPYATTMIRDVKVTDTTGLFNTDVTMNIEMGVE